MNHLSDTLFIIDIVVNFRTAIMIRQNGDDILISHGGYIALHYIQGFFLVDVISVGVPYDLLTSHKWMDWLSIAKILRLAKTARLLNRIHDKLTAGVQAAGGVKYVRRINLRRWC